MRNIVMVVSALVVLAGTGTAQRPKSLSAKVKAAVRSAVDSAATKAASATVDSLLGATGTSDCQATVGTQLVGSLKKKMAGAKATATTVAARCAADPTVAARQAAMLEAQAAQAATQATAARAMPSAASALASATPIGLAIGAAPVAFAGAKALGGLFGHKGPTKENMIKDLTKGRLELKGVKFIGASDALEDGYEDDFAALAEALQAIEGEYILNLPPEAADKAAPDTVMARRRLTKLSAQLAVAGIADGRLTLESRSPGLDPKKKSPKPGEARIEILRKPADDKP